MKKILLTTIILAMGLSSLSAQNLYVLRDNGTQEEFGLADDLKITFASRTMTVRKGETTTQFPLNAIHNFSFTKQSEGSSIALAMDDNGIRLFPNPVKDELTLEIQNFVQGATTFRIFDVSGRLMRTGRALSVETKINMQHFREGNYVLIVEQAGQQVQTFKIVKQ